MKILMVFDPAELHTHWTIGLGTAPVCLDTSTKSMFGNARVFFGSCRTTNVLFTTEDLTPFDQILNSEPEP